MRRARRQLDPSRSPGREALGRMGDTRLDPCLHASPGWEPAPQPTTARAAAALARTHVDPSCPARAALAELYAGADEDSGVRTIDRSHSDDPGHAREKLLRAATAIGRRSHAVPISQLDLPSLGPVRGSWSESGRPVRFAEPSARPPRRTRKARGQPNPVRVWLLALLTGLALAFAFEDQSLDKAIRLLGRLADLPGVQGGYASAQSARDTRGQRRALTGPTAATPLQEGRSQNGPPAPRSATRAPEQGPADAARQHTRTLERDVDGAHEQWASTAQPTTPRAEGASNPAPPPRPASIAMTEAKVRELRVAAARALFSGDRNQALEAYRALAALQPGTTVYALIATSLGRVTAPSGVAR